MQLAVAHGEVRLRVERDAHGAGRERQARRDPTRVVETRPAQLVVRDEIGILSHPPDGS
jgi:hypothetical protein